MRIVEMPNFSIKDMILDLADSLKIDSFEFVVYTPGNDDYGVPPRLRVSYDVSHVRGSQIENIRQEMVASIGELEFDESAYALGLSSLVNAGNVQFHTPQADFHLGVSNENLHKIYQFLEDAGQTEGYVIMSGNSYHFQGVDLMPDEVWRPYMDSLDDNFVDGNWVNSNLMDRGFSVLRLTPAYGKPQMPVVLSRVYQK